MAAQDSHNLIKDLNDRHTAEEYIEGLLKDPSAITYAIPSRHVQQLLEGR